MGQKAITVQRMTISAMLIAIGIVIPMFSPIKIILEPAASFTLASHVAIFIAMFIAPSVAVGVALGTTLGFLLAGFPIIVVFRAASHLIFATVGAFLLKKSPQLVASPKKTAVFAIGISLLHALGEVLIVSVFYLMGSAAGSLYNYGFAYSVLLLVGAGTVVHSMVDFYIALFIAKVLRKQKQLSPLFPELG